MTILKTERLILRPWCDQDLEPLAKMNADPRVMECFLAPLTQQESAERLEVYTKHIQEFGWGLWAVSAPGISDFMGWIGLWPIGFDAHFTPAMEVGWRLLPEFWGFGYATEGARASLQYGFEVLKLNEIVSITVMANMRSRRVMEKIGMHHNPKDDFEHPKVPEGHPLRKHVLYRLSREEWQAQEQIKNQSWRPPSTIRGKAIGIAKQNNCILVCEVLNDAGVLQGWVPLGGGIEFGETAQKALEREFQEEIGSAVEVIGPPVVFENIFDHHGSIGHEIVFAFPIVLNRKEIYTRTRFQISEQRGSSHWVEWVPIEHFQKQKALLFPPGILQRLEDFELNKNIKHNNRIENV